MTKEEKKDEEVIQEEVTEPITQQEEVEAQEVRVEDFAKNEPAKKPATSKKTKAKEILQKLDTENKELKDQLLKRRAEFENFRKRMEKEKADFAKYALEKELLDLLPIMDSFDRALHPDLIKEETQPVFDGFTLIYKQLLDFMSKQGVEEIASIGEQFDPHLHQAVSQEASEEHESGIVIKEYQKGYKFTNKILRPSMVVVAQ